MSLAPQWRLLRYFGTGIIDQVLLSAASFVAGILMIRFTNDVDYGHFVLAQSAVLLLVSAQGAGLSGPLSAIAPSKTPDIKRLMIGAVGTSQARFLRRTAPVLVALAALGYVLHFWTLIDALVGAASVLAGWTALHRAYVRSVLLIYSRPHSVLRADVVYVVVLVALISASLLSRPAAGVLSILALMAASWACAVTASRMLAADPGWTRGDARVFWAEIHPIARWSTVGAVTYWLFAQSYNYVLASRLNLTAVTDVNAARLVLMPVFVFTTGINNLLMPAAANWLAQYGLQRMLRRLGALALAIIAFDFAYFFFAWTFRGWLITDLLHKTIGDRDRLLILWACVALIFLLREVLQATLFALRKVRTMAWLIGASAAVSLALMWIGIARWGAAAVLIGQIVGECINLAGLTWLLWRNARALPPSTALSRPEI